jgi:tRNA threonylcarbamoyladenosine biosynthesis protein TsaB
MTILALEFSSDRRSVALIGAGQVLSRAEEHGGRSTQAFRLIEQVLKDAGREREDVETIAIGLGPGSYTGIRIAISIGQGWRMALGPTLVGISTADCLGEQARARGVRGPLHIAIDAQRGEFYHASFALTESGIQSVLALHITSREELVRRAAGQPIWCSPNLVGDFPAAEGVFPDAAILGLLAVHRVKEVSENELQPIYLRETSFVKAAPPRPVVLD